MGFSQNKCAPTIQPKVPCLPIFARPVWSRHDRSWPYFIDLIMATFNQRNSRNKMWRLTSRGKSKQVVTRCDRTCSVGASRSIPSRPVSSWRLCACRLMRNITKQSATWRIPTNASTAASKLTLQWCCNSSSMEYINEAFFTGPILWCHYDVTHQKTK